MAPRLATQQAKGLPSKPTTTWDAYVAARREVLSDRPTHLVAWPLLVTLTMVSSSLAAQVTGLELPKGPILDLPHSPFR
jgi:hypothetical protein